MTTIREAAEELRADDSIDPALIALAKADLYAFRWLFEAGAEWMREQAAQAQEAWAEKWATEDGLEALMFAEDDVAVVGVVEKLILARAAAIREIGEEK